MKAGQVTPAKLAFSLYDQGRYARVPALRSAASASVLGGQEPRREEIILRDFGSHSPLEHLSARAGDPEEVAVGHRNVSATREGATRAVGRYELLEIPEDP